MLYICNCFIFSLVTLNKVIQIFSIFWFGNFFYFCFLVDFLSCLYFSLLWFCLFVFLLETFSSYRPIEYVGNLMKICGSLITFRDFSLIFLSLFFFFNV